MTVLHQSYTVIAFMLRLNRTSFDKAIGQHGIQVIMVVRLTSVIALTTCGSLLFVTQTVTLNQ